MNIIGRRKIWYLISLVLIVPGVVGLFLWGLPLGIDFKGGTLLDVQYKTDTVNKDQITEKLKEVGLKDINVQPGADSTFLIRTDPLTNETIQKTTDALSKIGEGYKQNRLDSVGPTVSSDLKTKAIVAIIIASLAIIIYIAIAFRKVPKPASSWRFGVCAVLALIHDILFVVGSFAIFGHFFGYEINSLFITALLTIMGFSVHDTIVVFDRIRENLRKSPSLNFETNVNNSIIQTLNRSLNTSFTVLIVLLSLFLLGGETLKEFMLALLLGVSIGTYSSIFNATPMLVSWQGWTSNRLKKKNAS
ncbi:MAG: Protein translocase subunit SecF [Berkelbacteria bacterium GW2011_GWB1_38_5]|uniref:Protein-export membrane protein SecF n=2 Tax=Candidatus Berkelbacteria TaxID=1618330 RepID=A0A0G0FGC8_9BACT|nr:MAG: Protein translocase subunit SecF [Berkelbacteria bacterium GW2011_GWA1_36_9]KKQ72680.1 MAG: Protein translocase subunit SecF [Berkelbacteria bacterium GW2011_GWB1_38_5]